MKRKVQAIGSWIKKRVILVPERDKYDYIWFVFVCWLASTAEIIVLAIGRPTGASKFSRIIDIAIAVGVNSIGFVIASFVLAILLSCLYIPIPRLSTASMIYTMTIGVLILFYTKSGLLFSFVIGIGYGLAIWLLYLIISPFFRRKIGRLILLVIVTIIVLAGSIYSLVEKFSNDSQNMQVVTEHTDYPKETNPGKPGPYDVTFLTYGSGHDLHRDRFGDLVDEVTPTVDASSMVTKWKDKREDFWGFDQTELPINGRVWVPEGDGPFPVILMVHGNHTMEYFSTDGYDYLGEQLASRGFLAISVDEDFINYSNISGQPNDNYELRTWVLLQHLIQLKAMNQTQNSVLYEKMNLDNVALMGHSRGGQAVSMAADYNRFFDDEALEEELDSIHIKAVVAIAPTDKTINGEKPHLRNVSYLLLQGASDADVSSFKGDRQFYRTTFDPKDNGFKSTLYIADANHTQFNTSWGRSDLSLPRGLFLNRSDLMDASAQQQIARVYLSAFLEYVFHGESGYEQLFRDYRYGAEWLPETTLINKYRDTAYKSIKTFQGSDTETINVDGFTKSDVMTPKYRDDNNHPQDALLLEWDEDATYEMDLSKVDSETKENTDINHIILTMANIDSKENKSSSPEIEVEIETMDGVAVKLPLEEFMPVPPVIKTDFTSFGLLDNMFREGKYASSWEPVFQTFDIPIDSFETRGRPMKEEELKTMRLHFSGGPGEILLEEVGVTTRE